MAKLGRWFLLSLPLWLSVSLAGAQPGQQGKAPPGKAAQPTPPKPKGPIDLDSEGAEGEGEEGEKGEAKGEKEEEVVDDEPVTAGQQTPEAAQATRLFKDERWSEAALLLKRVVDGETNDDKGNRQIAEFQLAIALYRLEFYQSSYTIFRRIANRPNHQKFKDTLTWLAKLATQLPEPAGIISSVGKYPPEMLSQYDNDEQREVYWHLSYLLGRERYDDLKFPEAIRLFEQVGRDSPYFVKSQFFMGISNVRLRRSIPAVRAFQRIVKAIDDGIEGVEDEERMVDLANLSMARTLYSASIRLDANNVPTIDPKKLTLAVNYWNLVEPASEYWLDALFEESWAYYMAGDFPRALGNIHTIQSPYFPRAFYPEADIVRAVIYFTTCQFDDATILVSKFQVKYRPIAKELSGVLKSYEGEGGDQRFYNFLLQVRDGKTKLSPNVKAIVESALSDRELLRHMEYVKVLDKELTRFNSAPSSFRNSPVGADVEENIGKAKTEAIHNTGVLARKRYERNLEELGEHIRNSQKIIVDITNAQRRVLDKSIEAGEQWTKEDAYTFGRVDPDEEHQIWPFDGEYWRDELGFYRQVVYSECGGGGKKK
jgi:tetratricopeptide (TPR) repeat protein